MKPKTKIYRPNSEVNDAWLGLGDLNGLEIENPLIHRSQEDIENPGLLEVRLMRNPEYISFAAKILLDIELLPEQAVILEELWKRPFPMYIASRGFGKSFLLALYATLKCILCPGTKVVGTGAAFRQSRIIWEYMCNIWRNAPVMRSICNQSSGPKTKIDRVEMRINDSVAIFAPLGDGTKIRGLRANIIIADEFACLEGDSIVETDDGFIRISDFDRADHQYILTGDETYKYEKPSKFIKTPLTDVYEIKLENGYVIRCSEHHKLMTQHGWKTTLQLSPDDYIEQSDSKYTHFGKNIIHGLDEDLAWLLGILVSEGCVTDNKRISITTTDIKLCEKLVNNYNFKFDVIDAYTDDRGWNCKQSYKLWLYDETLRHKLYQLGLNYVTAHDKIIPWAILKSPENVIRSFLSGLFDGDGSCFLWQDRDTDNRIGLSYYSVSERLCRDVQFLMYKLGFDGYITSRTSNISDNLQWMVRWNNQTARDAAIYLSVDRFKDTVASCSLPPNPVNYCWDKSRNKWKASITYCGKTIQKRFKHKYDAENFVSKIKNQIPYRKVVSINKLDEQQHLYDYYLPQTHSFFAEGHRQHNSIPPDIYETVVGGFGSVTMKPIDNVKEVSRRKALKEAGRWTESDEHHFASKTGNQNIISGTADYDFMHFADYWRKYWVYIHSKNDPKKMIKMPNGEMKCLADYFGTDDIPPEFDYKDYSIIRIPYELIPKGFMDDKVVARAKATVHSSIYLKEYAACFPSDSDGFFKRTLIESTVAKESNVNGPNWPTWCNQPFDPLLRGVPGRKYVISIDPAAYRDNFAIVVLELWPEHARVVYCWSTNMSDFALRKKAGMTQNETNYFSYCARRIRNLSKVFPTEDIVIDAQGGGGEIMEALHDISKLEGGEVPWWPTNRILDPDKELPTDGEPGLHIIHPFQFAKYEWVLEANHGTRKDMEDKVLLLPRFDTVQLELANLKDSELAKKLNVDHIYDTLEDAVLEIEALKDEMCTIQVTRTGTGVQGRDRFDTPETTTAEGKKTRMRKDRYSALIMANFIARHIQRSPAPVEYNVIGGFAHQIASNKETSDKLYSSGPDWFIQGMNNKGGKNVISAVRRK